MLDSIGVPLDKLRFVRGTDYQLSKYGHSTHCVINIVENWEIVKQYIFESKSSIIRKHSQIQFRCIVLGSFL